MTSAAAEDRLLDLAEVCVSSRLPHQVSPLILPVTKRVRFSDF